MTLLQKWCWDHKLFLSVKKTRGLTLLIRMLRIPVRGSQFRFMEKVIYIWIYLGSGLSFIPHTKIVYKCAKETLNWMLAFARGNWGGIGYRPLLQIYRGTFVSIITYSVLAWYSLQAMDICYNLWGSLLFIILIQYEHCPVLRSCSQTPCYQYLSYAYGDKTDNHLFQRYHPLFLGTLWMRGLFPALAT